MVYIDLQLVYIDLQYVRSQKCNYICNLCRTQIRIDNFNVSLFSRKNILLFREEKIRRREETSQNIEENVLQEERMAQVTVLFLYYRLVRYIMLHEISRKPTQLCQLGAS